MVSEKEGRPVRENKKSHGGHGMGPQKSSWFLAPSFRSGLIDLYRSRMSFNQNHGSGNCKKAQGFSAILFPFSLQIVNINRGSCVDLLFQSFLDSDCLKHVLLAYQENRIGIARHFQLFLWFLGH